MPSIRNLHAAAEACAATRRRTSGGPIANSAAAAAVRRLSSTAPPRSSSGRRSPHAAPSPDSARAALEYCARLVRQHDPDSFAWAVLLPKEERARVLALRALNVEALLVPTSAGRRSSGDGAAAMLRIRYQWWRDAVRAAMDAPAVAEAEAAAAAEEEEDAEDLEADDDDEEEEEQEQEEQERGAAATTPPSAATRSRPRPLPPAHPVVTALWAARASAGPRLQRYPLRRLIDAREREALSAAAGEPPPLRLSDLEAHAEATHAQLLYAQLAAIGGDNSSSSSNAAAAADHAASHVGKAVGLAMALRGLPYAAAQRRCVLPLEVCASAGLSQEDVFRRAAALEAGRAPSERDWPPRADAALRDAVLEVASRAVGHLREARALLGGNGGEGGDGGAARLRKGQAHALLPAVAADLYLSALERTAQFDVFHPALRPPPPPTTTTTAGQPPPPPPLGAGLGVSPLRYLLSLRWHAWRGTF
jgi:NADH dehydrogenase [ubiquinone] 1 alpha subcomplex assembly factor 6